MSTIILIILVLLLIGALPNWGYTAAAGVCSFGLLERFSSSFSFSSCSGASSRLHHCSNLPRDELVVAVAQGFRFGSLPEATFSMRSKISRPFSSIETPSRISPQLMSMSSDHRR